MDRNILYRYALLTIVLVSLNSCKKDKLKDEKAFLIGTWNWIYTEHDYNWCNPPGNLEVIDPNSELTNYSIEFIEKGKIRFYKNGNLIDENRIVFDYFEENNFEEISFKIKLDNKKSNTIGGVGYDTLRFNHFPFSEEDPTCELYTNYFVKQ